MCQKMLCPVAKKGLSDPPSLRCFEYVDRRDLAGVSVPVQVFAALRAHCSEPYGVTPNLREERPTRTAVREPLEEISPPRGTLGHAEVGEHLGGQSEPPRFHRRLQA